jgi:hypothetical protein
MSSTGFHSKQVKEDNVAEVDIIIEQVMQRMAGSYNCGPICCGFPITLIDM